MKDSTPIPSNWEDFLSNIENKKDLNEYIAETMVNRSNIGANKILITTFNETILKLPYDSADVYEDLKPCNYEEADTRMFLHALNGSKNGIKNVTIESNDTDVVVIATALFWKLELEQLTVTFGRGKEHKKIPIHKISNTLGINKCSSLLLFHSLTGCDSTTALLGVAKPTAWKAWISSDETVISSLTVLTMD